MSERHPGYRFGDWTVEPGHNRISRDGEEHQLESRTMDVLAHLLDHNDEVVSAERLLDDLWPGRVVEQSTIHRQINQIRRVLGDDSKQPRYVRTVVKRGYQAIAPVRVLEQAAPGDDASSTTGQPAPPSSSGRKLSAGWAMGLIVVITIGAGLLWQMQQNSPAPERALPLQEPPSRPVIAVLPFTGLTGSPEESAMAAGLTAEVSSLLARQQTLDLISEFSSAQFRARATDIRQAQTLLGADYVLEGNVQLTGEEGRVSAWLSETTDGTRIWDRPFRFQLSELASYFTLYDQIAHDTVLGLQVSVDSGQHADPGTDSLEAYRAWHQALRHLRSGRYREGLRSAEQAVELDPEYADAHSLRSLLLRSLAEWGSIVPKQGYEAALAAADRALSIDDGHGMAYMSKSALIIRLELDFTKAWRLLDRADFYGASEWLTSVWRGELLFNTGRYEEALGYFRKAERLNPLSGGPNEQIARLLDRKGEIEASRKMFEDLLVGGLSNEGVGYFFEHLMFYDLERAAALANELDPAQVPFYVRPSIARALGDPEPLRQALDGWIEDRAERPVPAVLIAWMYYSLGDYERYLNWFDVQVDEQSSLHYLYDNLYGKDRGPDGYWGTLERWAGEDPDRMDRVIDHRHEVDHLMEKMVLPPGL